MGIGSFADPNYRDIAARTADSIPSAASPMTAPSASHVAAGTPSPARATAALSCHAPQRAHPSTAASSRRNFMVSPTVIRPRPVFSAVVPATGSPEVSSGAADRCEPKPSTRPDGLAGTVPEPVIGKQASGAQAPRPHVGPIRSLLCWAVLRQIDTVARPFAAGYSAVATGPILSHAGSP
jgi:hypothetical protein